MDGAMEPRGHPALKRWGPLVHPSASHVRLRGEKVAEYASFGIFAAQLNVNWPKAHENSRSGITEIMMPSKL